MNILGLSCYYHDSAACLVQDGRIVAAAQEERFSRKKHDAGFPRAAIDYVLREAGLGAQDIDMVGFYDKPVLKFTRILESFVSVAPRGLAAWLHFGPSWMREKLWVVDRIRKQLGGFEGPIRFAEHHESHAASAFYPSPFERSAVLTMDGVGEWATASIGVGEGRDLRLVRELRFPHSLGLLYAAFTYWLGFRVNSGEYKVMGLAPYGQPLYVDRIFETLVDLRPDGSFRLNLDYFGYLTSLRMTTSRFDELLGAPRREPETPLTQMHMDVARSVQAVTEEIMLRMARHAHEVTGEKNLCLAGGVALNCVGNGRIQREGPFERVWIQPAAGDAGGALGAALVLWHRYLDNPRVCDGADTMRGAYLGPEFSDDAISAVLDAAGVPYEVVAENEVVERAAALLGDGNVVGWFQGRMEYGPRALGARSILGDPRRTEMQERMNLKIKFRESFRPFAPAVLEERCADWFDQDGESPYMLLVSQVAGKRRVAPGPEHAGLRGLERLRAPLSEVPAVTHVDGSARVQTVGEKPGGAGGSWNPRFRALLQAFERLTGCPILINTSFNVRGEPIVCTPEDALACFLNTGMDYLVMGRHILGKKDGAAAERPAPDASAPAASAPVASARDVAAPVTTPPSGKQVGLPPVDGVATGTVGGARALNLLGLVTPLANLGMLRRAPKDLRWVGVVLGVALCAIATWAWFRGPQWGWMAALGVHYALVLLGLVHPRLPETPARAWVSFGTWIGKLVAYPIFSLMYYLAVTPTALLVRVFGSDPLARGAPPADSYWIERDAAPVEKYERQF